MNVELGDAIEKVFDNFKKVTPLLLAIALITGLILFLPENILEKMALNDLPNAWRIIVGLVFLLTSVLTVVIFLKSILKPIISRIRIKQYQQKMRNKYIQLSEDKKQIILDLLKRAGEPVELDSSLGIVRYLESSHFIVRTQNIGTFDEYGNGIVFPYMAQKWLMELYDREPTLFDS